MRALDDFLTRLSAMHNHLCPRQILGLRIGLYAGDLLGLDLPQADKRLVTFIETDGCFADGVSVASGCWMGRRTMRLMDHGKVAATFVDTVTERAYRIWPHLEARSRAVAYSDAPDHWHAQLEGYQRMPTDELLLAREVELTVAIKAIISRPGVRVNCTRCGEEIVNEREVLRDGETLCRSCAGDTYWQIVAVPSQADMQHGLEPA